jgi:hypothetical protein
MALPNQIQKQVKAAKEIIDKHAEGQQPGDEPPVVEPAAPAGGEPSADLAKGEGGQTPTQQEVPAAVEDENSITYKQRWLSLQGQFPVLSNRAAAAEARVTQLEQLIATMQSTPAPAPSPKSSTPLLSEKDTTEYGADMLDVMRRAAREELGGELQAKDEVIAQLTSRVQQLQGVVPAVNNLARNQQVSREEAFFNAIGREVPDWQTINQDPEFHAWLLANDPMTGITRQTYLSDAQHSFDVHRVANIFNTWKTLIGKTQVVPAKPNKAQTELEKQVAPGRTNASSPPASQPEKIWTSVDISQFYADVRRGAYKDRESERAALERDLFAAQREGRVRPAAA